MNEQPELMALREFAILVWRWLQEKDGISQNDIDDALKEIRKIQRDAKKRPN